METMSRGKKKPAFSKMFQSGQDVLKPLKVSIASEALLPERVIEATVLLMTTSRKSSFPPNLRPSIS